MKHNTLVTLFVIVLFFVACTGEEGGRKQYNKKQVEESMVEVNRILVAKDRKKIEGYIERMGYEMSETETGLWYQILRQGDGPAIREGQTVTLEYEITLLDGSVVYSSANDGKKVFTVGRGGVESGLEEGILLLNQAAVARLIMPPHLAHGLPGDGERIPARTIIVYELEVLSVE